MAELGRTIHSTLAAYQIPGGSSAYFTKVFKGEPEALMPTGGQALARWHVVRSQQPPEGARVIKAGGDRMTTVVYQINCYWPLSPLQESMEDKEDDIATVLIHLPNSFLALTPASYTIGGYPVAALTVEDVTPVERAFPFPSAERECRILTFELHARVLEAS